MGTNRRWSHQAGESWSKWGDPAYVASLRFVVRQRRQKLLTVAVWALAIGAWLGIAASVSARAGASITGPDGLHFGDTATVSFDAGHAKVDAFRWWAKAECFRTASTVGQDFGLDRDIVYAEYLHLGDQAGYPVNDDLATFGPTPSWTSGGADCSVTLLAYDGNGRFVPYATDDFEVLP